MLSKAANNSELLIKIKEGDQRAFEILFKKLNVRLCAFSRKFTQGNKESQDIASESFVKLWSARENFSTIEAMTVYLFKVVKNLSLKRIAKTKREFALTNELRYLSARLDTEIDPVDINLSVQMCNVYLAIEDLPKSCRQVFLMTALKKLKAHEIAKLLNISVYTVKAHKAQAIKKLRAKLNEKS